MADVVCLGEALIDFVAIDAGVSVGESSGFVRAPGGAPANVAVGIAKLGGSSAFLGKVGDDPFGRFLERTFSEAGVDTSGMVFSRRYRTGLAFVSLEESGERDFCFFRNPSADMTYTVSELDLSRLASGRIFHFGSITLINQPAQNTTLTAAQRARDAGLLLSYDPNVRLPLWPNPRTIRSTILKGFRFANIIKVSIEELKFLLRAEGESLTSAARQIMDQCPHIALLAITEGERGCTWVTRADHKQRPKRLSSHPGYSVTTVDTTGAGDGFVAGLLTGLLNAGLADAQTLARTPGRELASVFARANQVGALTTTQKGAIPALPTNDQLENALLKERA
jgi:fructokinase